MIEAAEKMSGLVQTTALQIMTTVMVAQQLHAEPADAHDLVCHMLLEFYTEMGMILEAAAISEEDEEEPQGYETVEEEE